jgi:hypothetical protein
MAVSTRPAPPRHFSPAADGARFAPPGRQRALPLVALGVLCAFAGALVFATAYLRSGHRVAVLVVARAVPAGSVIHDGDLRVARVSSDGGLQPVPAAQRGSVGGKVAAVPLAPGTLLARSQVGSGAAVAPGQAVVGVGLKSGQLPAGLRPGDRVMVVDTGAARPGGNGADTVGSVLVPAAVVFAVPATTDPASATVVSVVVSAPDAPRIAAASAAERVSLVLLGSGS